MLTGSVLNKTKIKTGVDDQWLP